MKTKSLTLMMMFFTSIIAQAQNALTVANTSMPQNGGELMFNYTFDEEGVYSAYQFKIETPEGITYVTDEVGDVECSLGECHTSSHTAVVHWNSTDKILGVGVTSMKSTLLMGISGKLISILLAATEAPVGTEFTFTVKDLTYIRQDGTKDKLDDVTFTITIGEPTEIRTILDETSTEMPEAASGVDVRVRRTLAADVWNTIVLPFAMTSQQVVEAFGDGVQLADFTGYEASCDDDDNVTAIKVSFSNVSAMEANHPYIIKVKEPISEFTVDGVDIDPAEDPVNAVIKRTRKQWSEMIGTYVANTVIPEQMLFLNGNQFWYSTGKSKMKAYRAYFDFYDVLSDVEGAETKISFVVDGEATDIVGISVPRCFEGDVYNVQGLYVGKAVDLNRLPKGIYIVNGKKYTVK